MLSASARPSAPQKSTEATPLARNIGLFDATMIVMGGIIGSGIFINPYVVAQRVHTAPLIIGAWAAGGVLALFGAFIYAELATVMPSVGGQYAYLREAYHPIVGFLYGWVLLLVIQTGGMAAVTVTFARYFLELTGLRAPETLVAAITLVILTAVNCAGVKAGSRVQSALMLLKIFAIGGLVICGFALVHVPHNLLHPALDQAPSFHLLTDFGAAMIPVLFAYGGWQTANFVAAEVKEPQKNLARALIVGVAGVVTLYLAVNIVCVRALGTSGLAASRVPASDVMNLALGKTGAMWIAAGIAVSTLGFLSQSVLTAPRVYFAMAADRVFFPPLAYVSPKTHVPIVAIIVQSVWTAVIAFSGRYEQILNYVVAMDFLFFGLTGTCIFAFRKRAGASQNEGRIPGHPLTTLFFIAACWLVVANTIYRYPANSLTGFAFLLLGVPVYWIWRTKHA